MYLRPEDVQNQLMSSQAPTITQDPCPCGSGESYRLCCGPLHWGLAHACTAEQLMRSRYSAVFYDLTDYLVTTLHPSKRDTVLAPSSSDQAPSQHRAWQHLRIVATHRGGSDQLDGEVEFVATYLQANEPRQLRERSQFVREEGRWFYISGNVEDRDIEPLGRNAPCWCQSGKKYKKCHGAKTRSIKP